MDRDNYNRAEQSKTTGFAKDNNFLDSMGEEKNDNFIISPEIMQPNPTSATPTIPIEMPARDTK